MNAITSNLVDEPTACRILGGEHTPIHRSTLWRGINARRYPAPVKVGPGTNRWLTTELDAFLKKAAEERALKIGRAY